MAEDQPNHYPTPKTQELSLLKTQISNFEYDAIKNSIENQPRLLMSNSDAPTLLQENFRYNALHIAARVGNAKVAQLVLSTISGKTFMAKLYPNDDDFTRNSRTKHLVDLYLNTPDKGTLETPLHFAAKFNHYEVAKLLIGHPLCDITRKNSTNQTAEDIIGSRASKGKEDNGEKIRNLFCDTKIVPIWSDHGGEYPPQVGKPMDFRYLGEFTPEPIIKVYGGDDALLELFGPVDLSCVPVKKLGSKRIIRAYAGPVDEDTAAKFQAAIKGTGVVSLDTSFNGIDSPKLCKTPPPEPTNYRNVLSPNGQVTPKQKRLTRKSIHEINYNTPKRAMTSFSSSTPESENKIPHTFQLSRTPINTGTPPPDFTPKRMSQMTSPRLFTPPAMISDKSARLKDPEKGLEIVGRKYAHEFSVPWTEKWKFLGEYCDLSTEEGMVLLEDHLFRVKEKECEREVTKEKGPQLDLNLTPESFLCKAMDRLTLDSEPRPNDVKRNLFLNHIDLFSDTESLDVYVNGTKPSKEDFQAYHAVSDNCISHLDGNKFPLLIGWYNSLKSSGDKRLIL